MGEFDIPLEEIFTDGEIHQSVSAFRLDISWEGG